MEDYSRQRHQDGGYEFVYTPHLANANLFETSGHLDWYDDGMYPPMEMDNGTYYPKPMNCPMHCLIFRSRPAQLPRAAAAAVRARHRVPLRAGRHAARADAHPRLHPGRQPHLLHAGAAGRRDRLAARLRALGAAGVRLRGLQVQPVDQGPEEVRRLRRDLGEGHRRAARRRSSATAWSTRSRRATPPSTARRSTSTSRTPSAAAGSCRRSSTTSTTPSASSSSTSARTTPATGRSCCTGPCSGSIERFFGVLLEHYAGRVPDVAGAGPGARAAGGHGPRGLRRRGRRRSCAPRACGSTWSTPATSSASGSATPSWRRSRTSSWSATTTSPPAPSGSTPAAATCERGVGVGDFLGRLRTEIDDELKRAPRLSSSFQFARHRRRCPAP